MPKTGTSKAFLKIGNPISSSRPLPGCSKSATQPRVQFSTSPRSPSVKMPQVSLTAKSSSLVCKPSSTEMLAGAKHVKDDLFIQQPLYVSSRPGSCKVSFQQSEECIDKVCHSPSKSSRHPDSIFNTNTASPSNNKNLILGLDRTSGLNMQTFPGGVFHHVKNTSVNYHVGGLLSCSPTSDMGTQKEDGDLLEQGNLNDQSCTLSCSAEEVDMELDMMGDRDVGIIDKPVARPVAFEVKNFSKFPLPNDAHVALSPQHVLLNSANVATNTAELPDLSIPDAPPGLITTVAAQQKASMKFNIDKWTYHKVEGASTLFTESFNSRDEICSSEKKALVGPSCGIPPDSLQTVIEHLKPEVSSTNSSFLRLFPSVAEPGHSEVENHRMDCDISGINERTKNGFPVNDEVLVLSLARPQYVKDGNNWITVLTMERLQQDGCSEELKLTL